MNIRVSNILSVKRHLSERNTLSAMLDSLSTGADDAGIGTCIYTTLNTCLIKVFQLLIQILSFLKPKIQIQIQLLF